MDKLHELQSCNSLYIWCNSLQFKLQFSQNNSFSTIMQLHYNCTHDVMLNSLIVIHLLQSKHMALWKKIRHKIIFFKILISILHYDC
jgi:hypothetical protein